MPRTFPNALQQDDLVDDFKCNQAAKALINSIANHLRGDLKIMLTIRPFSNYI